VDEMNRPNSSNSSDATNSEAFELLALRYLDGLHTEEESRQLSEQLAASADRRELFAALSLEMAMLKEMSLGQIDDSQSPEAKNTEQAGLGRPLIFGDFDSAEPKTGDLWFSFSRPVYWAMVAAVVACGLGVWLVRSGFNKPLQGEVAAAKDGSSLDVAGVSLESGTTKLSLPKVGYAVFEGPAEFELLSPMRARLSSGRMKMRITEPMGRGFVVETPYGEVTDLGTEFGLDVGSKGKTGLVVFEGMVDLRMARESQDSPTFSRVERLVGGDGVTFDQVGQLDRIMSIATGKSATFQSGDELAAESSRSIIAGVSDNLRASDTKKFYEVVPGGFGEDVLAYVDRKYEWNGLDANGIPKFLVGGDYVLPFNDDKAKGIEITVTVARPATVYVLFDSRGKPPKWLSRDFVDTGLKVGMDENEPEYETRKSDFRPTSELGKGPGNSIDYSFSIWKRELAAPGTVVLGPRGGVRTGVRRRSMYGIVVTPLDAGTARLANAL
jgi:hypothetical protein